MSADPTSNVSAHAPLATTLFDLDAAPGHLIRRAQQWAVAQFVLACSPYDLTPVQFAALSALAAQPDSDQLRLAQRLALDAATVGSVLLRLEAKGWIHRSPDPTDKRRKRLSISPAGQAHLALATPAAAAAQTAMLSPLSEAEQTQLLLLLNKLVYKVSLNG